MHRNELPTMVLWKKYQKKTSNLSVSPKFWVTSDGAFAWLGKRALILITLWCIPDIKCNLIPIDLDRWPTTLNYNPNLVIKKDDPRAKIQTDRRTGATIRIISLLRGKSDLFISRFGVIDKVDYPNVQQLHIINSGVMSFTMDAFTSMGQLQVHVYCTLCFVKILL